MGCLVNIVYLEDWIDPEAAIEGNDVDPDQIGKGQSGCDCHLEVDLLQFASETTDILFIRVIKILTPTFLGG